MIHLVKKIFQPIYSVPFVEELNLNDRESHPKRRGQEQHPHLFAGVRPQLPSRKWWADRADSMNQRKATNRLREKTGWATVTRAKADRDGQPAGRRQALQAVLLLWSLEE